MGNVTQLIAAANDGDAAAVDQIFTALMPDLKRIAAARLRSSGPLTLLDTTSLVNESYLKLASGAGLVINDRKHFLAYCARMMRSIIIDLVRSREADRHGGGADRVTLDTALSEMLGAEVAITEVHDALSDLEKLDPELALIVEMRYFGGLTEIEIGEALEMSERSVRRAWEKARLFLGAHLTVH